MAASLQILVVEDEPSIADNIVYALETDGYDPVRCATGEEALSLCAQSSFSLILMDVGLPGMDGFEVCRKLRETSNIPVIFVTAREREIDRVVGLEIGGDDYVVKPFSPRELTARVKAVLRRYQENASNQSPLSPNSDFELNEERLEICYHNEVLPLSRYEFRILRIFMAHPGRVYSRNQVMTLAWEEPEAAMDRTVDAHIKSLRAKLRKVNAETSPIKTHRGEGYSLREHE